MPDITASPEEIQAASEMFDDMCRERHAQGADEYGPVAFLQNDTIEMLAEELLDTANYARYHFIKLLLINNQMMQEQTSFARPSEEEMQK